MATTLLEYIYNHLWFADQIPNATMSLKRTRESTDDEITKETETPTNKEKKKCCLICYTEKPRKIKLCPNKCVYHSCVECFLKMTVRNVMTTDISALKHRCVLCRTNFRITIKKLHRMTKSLGDFALPIGSVDRTDNSHYELRRVDNTYKLTRKLAECTIDGENQHWQDNTGLNNIVPLTAFPTATMMLIRRLQRPYSEE